MKTFLKISLLVSCLINSHLSKAQPLNFSENQKAHRHYWFYRTRMINDFIKIGNEQGDCIVLAERNQGRYDSTAKVGSDQIDITNQYLSALALEYKLLTRNNQNTDETIKEIFYLIKTINRLDARADLFWTSSTLPTEDLSAYSETANLNGFMLREDMHTNYLPKNLAHYNYELLENGYDGVNAASVPDPLNTYKSFTGLEHVSKLDNDNNFSNWEYFTNFNVDKHTSDLPLVHDKYYSMFVAFMLIIKYLPDVFIVIVPAPALTVQLLL